MVEITRELVIKVVGIVAGILLLVYLIDCYNSSASFSGFTDGAAAASTGTSSSPADQQPGTSSQLLTSLTSGLAAQLNAAGGSIGVTPSGEFVQSHQTQPPSTSGFADFGQYASVEGGDSMMGAGPVPQGAPGCFPRQQIQSADLLPSDKASAWAKSNPMGSGDLNMKNFLAAGYHIGIDSIGQSKKNGNLQLRSDPPIPQMPVGPWNNSPYQKDEYRRTFEIQ